MVPLSAGWQLPRPDSAGVVRLPSSVLLCSFVFAFVHFFTRREIHSYLGRACLPDSVGVQVFSTRLGCRSSRLGWGSGLLDSSWWCRSSRRGWGAGLPDSVGRACLPGSVGGARLPDSVGGARLLDSTRPCMSSRFDQAVHVFSIRLAVQVFLIRLPGSSFSALRWGSAHDATRSDGEPMHRRRHAVHASGRRGRITATRENGGEARSRFERRGQGGRD